MSETPAGSLSRQESARYARQLLLPQLGVAGQARLRAGRVLVIGAGGLGSPVLEYLAAAGVGTLGIIDDDVVEESNLHRQVIHSLSGEGQPKVESAASRIRALTGGLTQVETHNYRLGPKNAHEVLGHYDVVVDGADNFPTRYLVADVTANLGVPVVWGSILGFDAQVSVFWSQPPVGAGVTLRDVFPNPPAPGVVPSCGEAGVIGALCGQAGSVMAMEAIKLVARFGEPLLGKLLVIDALGARYVEVPLRPDHAQTRRPFFPRNTPCFPEVDPSHLGGSRRVIVDVRETIEFVAGHIPGAKSVPLSGLDGAAAGSLEGQPLVLYCQSGRRALLAAEELHSWGVEDIAVLAGSYDAWERTRL